MNEKQEISIKDLDFNNEDLEMLVRITQEKSEVFIYISDELSIAEDIGKMSNIMKQKIADIINKSNIWHTLAIEKIKNMSENIDTWELVSIYILNEIKHEDEDMIFGLGFEQFGNEHGIGMKISFKDMSIIEYGEGDVAFC